MPLWVAIEGMGDGIAAPSNARAAVIIIARIPESASFTLHGCPNLMCRRYGEVRQVLRQARALNQATDTLL